SSMRSSGPARTSWPCARSVAAVRSASGNGRVTSSLMTQAAGAASLLPLPVGERVGVRGLQSLRYLLTAGTPSPDLASLDRPLPDGERWKLRYGSAMCTGILSG